MTSSSKSARAAALALAVVMGLGAGSAGAAEIRVLLGVDPADASGDVLLSASLAPAQSLTRATGSRTTITQTSTMAEVMRASRTVENEIIIAPAHVTASAILHAYQLLGDERPGADLRAGRQERHRQGREAGRQAPLPAAAGLAAQLHGQGPAHRVGPEAGPVLEGHLRQHQRRRPGRAVVRHGRRHRRRRDAGQGMDHPASRPGAHPEDDAAGAGRHEHGRAQGLLRHRMRPSRRLGQLARRRHSRASAASAWRRPTQARQFTYVASLGIATPEAINGVTRVSAEQVAELAKQGVTIVDTRSQKEFDNEHIRGAVLASYLEKSLKEIDFDAKKDDFTRPQDDPEGQAGRLPLQRAGMLEVVQGVAGRARRGLHQDLLVPRRHAGVAREAPAGRRQRRRGARQAAARRRRSRRAARRSPPFAEAAAEGGGVAAAAGLGLAAQVDDALALLAVEPEAARGCGCRRDRSCRAGRRCRSARRLRAGRRAPTAGRGAARAARRQRSTSSRCRTPSPR